MADIDLVKAFDTINHQMIISILTRMGVFPKIIKFIKSMNSEFKMEMKIGNLNKFIYYITGSKQGDNWHQHYLSY